MRLKALLNKLCVPTQQQLNSRMSLHAKAIEAYREAVELHNKAIDVFVTCIVEEIQRGVLLAASKMKTSFVYNMRDCITSKNQLLNDHLAPLYDKEWEEITAKVTAKLEEICGHMQFEFAQNPKSVKLVWSFE